MTTRRLRRRVSLLLFVTMNVHALTPSSPLRRRAQAVLEGRLPNLYKSVTLNTGSGGCAGDQDAILNIYRGTSGPNSTTVLHLPGGAYMNLVGDTVDVAGASYVEAGYTLAVLYYRLPRSNTSQNWIVCSDPYEALQDVYAAIHHLRDNSDEYNVNPNSIVTSGFSAGGHLAALHGTTCVGGSAIDCPNAMILHFPFLETGAKIFCADIGSAFANNPVEDECFPTALVDAATPPTVLYHATNDPLVPTSWITDFIAALTEHGVSNEYHEVPGGGHYLVPFDQVAAVSGGVFTSQDNYSAFVTRALALPSSSCTRCDDVATHWMNTNHQTCQNGTWQIQNRCNGDVSWVNSGYCRRSCYDADRGYDGDVCCEEESSTPPSCTDCDDVPSPWMVNNGQTCETGSWSINNRCNQDDGWINAGYCRQSCFDAGRGYDGYDCCEATPPSSCIECDNVPSTWMIDNGLTCDTGTWSVNNNCNANAFWVTNQFCRSSCYVAGLGYDNDVCC